MMTLYVPKTLCFPMVVITLYVQGFQSTSVSQALNNLGLVFFIGGLIVIRVWGGV